MCVLVCLYLHRFHYTLTLSMQTCAPFLFKLIYCPNFQFNFIFPTFSLISFSLLSVSFSLLSAWFYFPYFQFYFIFITFSSIYSPCFQFHFIFPTFSFIFTTFSFISFFLLCSPNFQFHFIFPTFRSIYFPYFQFHFIFTLICFVGIRERKRNSRMLGILNFKLLFMCFSTISKEFNLDYFSFGSHSFYYCIYPTRGDLLEMVDFWKRLGEHLLVI